MLFCSEDTWYCQLKVHICIPSTTHQTPDQFWDGEKLSHYFSKWAPYTFYASNISSIINKWFRYSVILAFYIGIRQYTILHSPSIYWGFFSDEKYIIRKTLKIWTCHLSNMHNPLFICKDLKLATLWESLNSIFITEIVI